MMIVPDSKPPYRLMGMGAVLLAGLVVWSFRRAKRSAIVTGTWKTEERRAAKPVKALQETSAPKQRLQGARAKAPAKTSRRRTVAA